jgi:hypothetical protein
MDYAKNFNAFMVKSQRLEQHHESRQIRIFLKISFRLLKRSAIEVSRWATGSRVIIHCGVMVIGQQHDATQPT